MALEQIVQVFDGGGRTALDGFAAGHFDALAGGERATVFGLAAARVPPGQYDELAMQALGKVDLADACALLERKLDEAPNDVCRAITLGALLDATGDTRYESALILLLESDDWTVRDKALNYLTRLDRPDDARLLTAFEQRLLVEPREDLRARLADEVVYRRRVVPRGRVDRELLAWTDRLTSVNPAEREHALSDLEAASRGR